VCVPALTLAIENAAVFMTWPLCLVGGLLHAGFDQALMKSRLYTWPAIILLSRCLRVA